MSYAAIVPIGGHAGWAFLQRTRMQQQEAMSASPGQQRLTDRFAEKIASITSAEDLVSDRALREVALGAFGLQDDMENRAFLIQVLNSNTYDEGSLASRLGDKRYLTFARTFGFGDIGGARTGDVGFARRTIDAFQDQQFEISVGDSDENLRLAMSVERELARINERSSLSDDARWYTVMATPPLRAVFQTALGLPDSFGALDVDQQLQEFRARAESRLGSGKVSDFSSTEMQEKLISTFLSGSEAKALAAGSSSSGQLALTVLSQIQPLY